MRPLYIVAAGIALIAGAAARAGADHLVVQKNKAFSVASLKVKVGDMVTFRNDDAVFHNVFSLSDTLPFDLGSYGQGHSKTLTMDKPGTIAVECAIHPKMQLVIEVSR